MINWYLEHCPFVNTVASQGPGRPPQRMSCRRGRIWQASDYADARRHPGAVHSIASRTKSIHTMMAHRGGRSR